MTAKTKNEDNRTFNYHGSVISYVLTRKKVKNINLRVRLDGTVAVSAPNSVPMATIKSFIQSKGDFILNAQQKFANMPQKSDRKFIFIHKEEILIQVFDEVYEIFKPYIKAKPTLKIRTMKTRWGSCTPVHNSITLNRNLLAYPRQTIKYVAIHEYCHLFHPNHSKDFYDLLTKIMPNWQEHRNILKYN